MIFPTGRNLLSAFQYFTITCSGTGVLGQYDVVYSMLAWQDYFMILWARRAVDENLNRLRRLRFFL